MPKSAREKDLDPDTFIGIGLPLGRSSKGFFKQTKTSLEQAGHNIRNLLLTIPGERVNQPEFGSRLHHLLFEQVDDDFVDDECHGDVWHGDGNYPLYNTSEIAYGVISQDFK